MLQWCALRKLSLWYNLSLKVRSFLWEKASLDLGWPTLFFWLENDIFPWLPQWLSLTNLPENIFTNHYLSHLNQAAWTPAPKNGFIFLLIKIIKLIKRLSFPSDPSSWWWQMMLRVPQALGRCSSLAHVLALSSDSNWWLCRICLIETICGREILRDSCTQGGSVLMYGAISLRILEGSRNLVWGTAPQILKQQNLDLVMFCGFPGQAHVKKLL